MYDTAQDRRSEGKGSIDMDSKHENYWQSQEQPTFNHTKKTKRKANKGPVIGIILVVLCIILLALTQFGGIRHAIDDVPVIGVLPEIVDKIPVIGQIDEIIEKIPGVGDSKGPDRAFTDVDYIPQEHFDKPILRSEEEIAETGITAEDVLALYDQLAWEFAKLRWKDNFIENNTPMEGNFSAQFDRIDVCNNYHFDPYLTDKEDYPFYGINTNGHINDFFGSILQKLFKTPIV